MLMISARGAVLVEDASVAASGWDLDSCWVGGESEEGHWMSNTKRPRTSKPSKKSEPARAAARAVSGARTAAKPVKRTATRGSAQTELFAKAPEKPARG